MRGPERHRLAALNPIGWLSCPPAIGLNPFFIRAWVQTERANALRTAGYVQAEHLRDPRYELLWGELD